MMMISVSGVGRRQRQRDKGKRKRDDLIRMLPNVWRPRSSAISKHVFAQVPRVVKDFLAGPLVGSVPVLVPVLVLAVPSS